MNLHIFQNYMQIYNAFSNFFKFGKTLKYSAFKKKQWDLSGA